MQPSESRFQLVENVEDAIIRMSEEEQSSVQTETISTANKEKTGKSENKQSVNKEQTKNNENQQPLNKEQTKLKPHQQTQNYIRSQAAIQKMQTRLEQAPNYAKYYQEVESTPAAMDQKLNEVQADYEFQDFETKQMGELDGLKCRCEKITTEMQEYTKQNYQDYNGYLRGTKLDVRKDTPEKVKNLKEGLKECRISRDIVVRREVGGLDVLANMMNLQLDKKADGYADKLKDAVKEKIKEHQGKDVILTDPAFISTTYEPGGSWITAGEGVEFIINVKKGTQAVNTSGLSSNQGENEILLNAGTKFKLVKIYYNGCEGEEERPLCIEQIDKTKVFPKGQKYWKVYLETIPSEKEGLLKENGGGTE